jgi:hypothetical protein
MLNDNGPDLDSQPSKLWASHQEFQAFQATEPINSPLPDVNNLANAISQMTLGNMYIRFACEIDLVVTNSSHNSMHDSMPPGSRSTRDSSESDTAFPGHSEISNEQ